MKESSHWAQPKFLTQSDMNSNKWLRTFLVVQWLRLCTPNAGDLSSSPVQGTRFYMPLTKIKSSHVPQLRPSVAKKVNKKYIINNYWKIMNTFCCKPLNFGGLLYSSAQLINSTQILFFYSWRVLEIKIEPFTLTHKSAKNLEGLGWPSLSPLVFMYPIKKSNFVKSYSSDTKMLLTDFFGWRIS